MWAQNNHNEKNRVKVSETVPSSDEIVKQKEYHILRSLEVSTTFKYLKDVWMPVSCHFLMKFISLCTKVHTRE